MNTAKVIIGAGYGDEGKGLATDYMVGTIQGDPLVVRYNGGAQAGHTVQTPAGDRHIFSHFGSGTLQGATTGLSRYFVCHPMLFHQEYQLLRELGLDPRVIVDPEAPVTTPYEVMINQAVEAARGNGKHGSCGIGFGETIEREEKSALRLRACDLTDPIFVARQLQRIRDEYLPIRLTALGLPPLATELLDDGIISSFVRDALDFVKRVELKEMALASRGKDVIYEGAQGLLLDMDRGYFPHVTRSNTGLKNVVTLAQEAAIDSLDVSYITRAYVSRHGAGPLLHELPDKPFAGVIDQTNVGNTWQGDLRFAWLDLDVLRNAIQDDLSDAVGLINSTQLLMTCLDQIDTSVAIVDQGRLIMSERNALPEWAAHRVEVNDALCCYGPTREDVRRPGRSRHAA